jgi:hypothetical protein
MGASTAGVYPVIDAGEDACGPLGVSRDQRPIGVTGEDGVTQIADLVVGCHRSIALRPDRPGADDERQLGLAVMYVPGTSFPTLSGTKHFYFILASFAFRKSTAIHRWYGYRRSFHFPSPLSAFGNLRITPVPTIPALPAI